MPKTKDDTSRARILEVATKLFAEQGFDSTSIRQICKEAGANVCMISYYWGGKQELYNGILDDLLERQTAFVKTFIDPEQDFSKMTPHEQIEHLHFLLNKMIDFFYSKQLSKELILFLLKAQQHSNSFVAKSPAFNYLRRLIACVFKSDINDRETILKTVFLISQINSPRILPTFSLGLLNQEDFTQEDINIIRENLKLYLNSLLKEAKIV